MYPYSCFAIARMVEVLPVPGGPYISMCGIYKRVLMSVLVEEEEVVRGACQKDTGVANSKGNGHDS